MSKQVTIDKMIEMRLTAMADAFAVQADDPKMLDIPFAYSSNGDGFVEHDFLTGKERELALADFPTEQELIARFKAGCNHGEGITPAQQTMLSQPYYSSQTTYAPRYYQRIAINRTVDAVVRGQNRTSSAFQIFSWRWPKPVRMVTI